MTPRPPCSSQGQALGVGQPREFRVPIEKGVPLTRARPPFKYPWDDLEIGDSVFVPGLNLSTAQSGCRRGNITRAPKRFCWRKVAGGVRIYRVK